MCLLFETIKIVDGAVCNLSYHQQRVRIWSDIDLLTYITKNVILPTAGLHKLRITYNNTHICNHSLELYTPRRVESLKIVTDNNIDYSKKFNDRTALNNLLSLNGYYDDILIIKNGTVSDTSFANIVFFDGQRWVTPDTPLLEGTCRARLIDQNIITPQAITFNDLNLFSKFIIINAMLDLDHQCAIEYNLNGDNLALKI